MTPVPHIQMEVPLDQDWTTLKTVCGSNTAASSGSNPADICLATGGARAKCTSTRRRILNPLEQDFLWAMTIKQRPKWAGLLALVMTTFQGRAPPHTFYFLACTTLRLPERAYTVVTFQAFAVEVLRTLTTQ